MNTFDFEKPLKSERFSETAEELVAGRRVRLVSCEDPYTNLKPGSEGTVLFVDAVDTVHVDWDNGSALGLVEGVDQWRFI